MSFLVAVRPASAFSLKKPFFSSRVRARASLVVSLGTATFTLSSFATAEAASEEAAVLEAAELAVEEEPPQAVRAAAAAATPVTFRKSRRVIIVFPSLLLDIMYSGGAAQSAPALNGSIKKASVPASHALHKDGGLKLPWYHLGSQHPRGHCLKTAAEFFLLTAGRFNGRTRRGLVLLLFVRAAPRPFSAPCFLPFSTCRALW